MSPPDSDANLVGVEFVLSDLDAALIFMDVADVSGIQETVIRNHKNAHHAYDTVLRLLRNLMPDALQQQTIDTKLALLKKEAAGSRTAILSGVGTHPCETRSLTLVALRHCPRTALS